MTPVRASREEAADAGIGFGVTMADPNRIRFKLKDRTLYVIINNKFVPDDDET